MAGPATPKRSVRTTGGFVVGVLGVKRAASTTMGALASGAIRIVAVVASTTARELTMERPSMVGGLGGGVGPRKKLAGGPARLVSASRFSRSSTRGRAEGGVRRRGRRIMVKSLRRDGRTTFEYRRVRGETLAISPRAGARSDRHGIRKRHGDPNAKPQGHGPTSPVASHHRNQPS